MANSASCQPPGPLASDAGSGSDRRALQCRSITAALVVLWSLCGVAGCKREAPLVSPPRAAKPFVSERCVAPPRPPARVRLTPMFEGLQIAAPVALVQARRLPGEASGRWFIADQHGIVKSFLVGADGKASDVVSTDLKDRVHQGEGLDERGLLGLALHPRFPEDPRLFVGYTHDEGGTKSQVSSFVVKAGKLDTAHETRILQLTQPYSNHNGGHLAFGPDGLLYIGFGDGGSGGDPLGNGQKLETLLGKMLRIDVDVSGESERPYGIPKDNPFVGGGGLPEIYATGLRNPWRYSFDRQNGELWVGDVGQDVWEEIDVVVKGGNYGWSVREGFRCYPPDASDCTKDGLIDPVTVYQHPDANQHRSVTGGFVYRGSTLPDLVGSYVFADYVTGEIWALPQSQRETGHKAEALLESGLNVSSFAEDEAGELYVLDYGGGRVLRLDVGDEQGASLPTKLSDTGCFDPDRPGQITKDAVPYEVALPFWSDGADKERFIVLPKGEKLERTAGNDFEVPKGTVLIKNFRLGKKLIETRFYVRHSDGEYSGYSYAWRDDGSDAELVTQTTHKSIAGHNWIYPGREQCNQCHTAAAGRSLGLELPQLALQHGGQRQLDTLSDRNVFAAGALEPNAAAFAAITDDKRSLQERARAYLHVNCSTCHRPMGPGRGGLDLRVDTPLESSGLCGKATLDDLGTAAGRVIAPGKPMDSVLVQRMSRRDERGMPPVASGQVDETGVELIRRWVESLQVCP